MADSLVSGALEKLISVAGQQIKLFAGATDELEKLKDSFQSIRAVLGDAESRQFGEESARVWLSKLKHVAYDIDDVLDEGKISGVGEGDDEGHSRNKVRQCLLSPYSRLNHVVSRYKVAHHIKKIRERLDQIADDKNKYSTSSIGGDDRMLVRRERLTSSLIDESEMIIGRESDKEILVSRLVSGSSHEGDEGQFHVVAVVGIGGLGKTTLAQQIYHDRKVQNHFDKSLWVCVSDVFDVIRLTKAILEEIERTGTSLSEPNSLQNKLLEELRGKRFLLVLDDVWNDDEDKWKKLQLPLNSGAQGSRILVTTRSDKVANTMKATYIHDLKGLSDDQSWTLFSSRAFVGRNAEERSKLESVGREIVNKCKGVPLSIKVIGSAMNSKATVEDWEGILNSKIWSLSSVTSKILPALLLTYYNLPTHLKQCFVYCSMFPKDWLFKKDTLVRLWVAQGFIRWEESRETDDVGAEYFEELVAWSILQRTEIYRETKITMHDLLHELGEFISKDEIHALSSTSEGGKSDVRHAFISFTGTGDSSNKIPITLRGAKKLRTLFLHGVYDENHEVILAALFKQSSFLRAVVFENSRIVRLPNAIGKMKHLRYFNLLWSDIVELPESMSHLSNLHTLNLNNCRYLEKLPRGIGGMVSLRHLQIEGTQSLESLPHSFGQLKALNQLEISNCDSLGSLPDSLGQLESLQQLEITRCDKLESLPHSFGKLKALNQLKISTCHALGSLPHSFGQLKALNQLEISYCGALGSLPDSLGQLESLQHLRILRCEELESLPHSFGQLKALNQLKISRCDALVSLPDSVGRLESLQQLKITGCKKLKSLPHSFGQLKALNQLKISFCCALGSLPDSLGQLESLQQLEIRECEELKSLPHSFGRLKALSQLEIRDCHALGSLPNSLGQLASLQRLEITGCEKLESLPHSFGQLKALSYLQTGHCYTLRSLPDSLGQLGSLQQLEIRDYVKLETLPHSFGQFKMLNQLVISGCRVLGSLPDSLGQLASLQQLQITGCKKLESLPHSFGQLKALNQLEISYCNALGSLPDSLGQLESLQQLVITSCGKLESLPHSFGRLKALNYLKICDCRALRSLPASIGQLESLQQLVIMFCGKLESMPHSFGQLKALNQLEINSCYSLGSLPHSFGQLKALNQLVINSCYSLGSLPDGLQHLSLLQQVTIYGCPLLSERCKRDGGEDWPKISHIPEIHIHHRESIQ